MNVQYLSLTENVSFSKIISDYLAGNAALNEFHEGLPSFEELGQRILARDQFNTQRDVLVAALQAQHANLSHRPSEARIAELQQKQVYTITTGHQLCVGTGPLYFIYKIASAIKLTRDLHVRFPDKKFIPIYWMASEDHDVEEISSFNVFGKKIEWANPGTGAVGRLSTNGIADMIAELQSILGNAPAEQKWIEILEKAYSKSTLAEATRDLVYAIFGTNELIVLDADDASLKRLFAPIMKQELTTGQSYLSVSIANTQLEKLGYSLQVAPREINLFLLEDQKRTRILPEHVNQELLERLENHPQDFSPNVVLRPVYQECILPNIAYVGGPGELAYWLQLKGVFGQCAVPYPSLILRDSALLISNNLCKKIEKLQLEWSDLFREKQVIINHWLSAHGEIDTTEERTNLDHLFQSLTTKATAIDPTLAGFVASEYTRQLSALDGVEKKMKKALKSKEDQRIQQLEKILSECFPDGQPQERVVNASQFVGQWPEDFMEKLIASFDPLALQMKVICL